MGSGSRLQCFCNLDCLMLPSRRCQGKGYLCGVEWTASRESRCPLQFVYAVIVNTCLNVILAEEKRAP